MTLQELIDARAKLVVEMRDMLGKAEADDNRELSAEESGQYEKMDTDYVTLDKQIREEEENRSRAAERVKKLAEREDFMKRPANEPLKPEPDQRDDKPPKAEQKKSVIATDEYRSAFGAFLRGDSFTPEQARAVEESRALQVDLDASGGFLVAAEDFRAQLIKKLDDMVFFRQFGTVISCSGQSVGFPVLDNDPGTSTLAWTGEILTGAEDSTMDFVKRALTPKPLGRRIKVSDTLLRVAELNVEQIVKDRLAYVFSIVEEFNFLQGDGTNEPLGVLTADAAGIDTDRDTTAASTTAITSDELYNVVYALKPQYRQNARWIIGRTAMQNIMKLKTGEGDYIWKPGISAGQPTLLCGYQVSESEYMPAFTTGNYVGAFADFSFYWIAERLSFQVKVLKELYAATNQTGIIARRELDAMPVVSEAFQRIALA